MRRLSCLSDSSVFITHSFSANIGLKHKDDGSLVKEYLPPDYETDYAMQTVVDNVECEDTRYAEQPALPISEEFPRFTEVFFLGNVNYGCPACVVGQSKKSLAVQLV